MSSSDFSGISFPMPPPTHRVEPEKPISKESHPFPTNRLLESAADTSPFATLEAKQFTFTDVPSLDQLSVKEKELSKLLELIEHDSPSFNQHIESLIKDRSGEFIQHLIDKKISAPSVSFTASSEGFEADVLEWQMEFAAFLEILPEDTGSSSGVAGLDFVAAFIQSLGHVGSIFLMGMHLRKAIEVLNFKQKAAEKVTDPEAKKMLLQEIEILKSWVKAYSRTVNYFLKYEVVEASISVPKLISSLASLISGGETATSAISDWVGIGLSLVASAYRVHRAHGDKKLFVDWTQGFKGTVFKPDVIAREKKALEAKKVRNLPKLETMTRQSLALPSIEKQAATLKEIGWEVPDVPSEEALKELVNDPVAKEKANENMVKKSEGLSVSLRNALKSLAAKKANIDLGFVKLRLRRAQALLASASVICGLMIALKVMVVVGITAAAAALIAVGYAMLAVTVGVIAIGAIYFRVKKPNLFKEYLKGTKTKLLLHKIPLLIQSFRQHHTTMEMRKLSTSILVKKSQLAEIRLYFTEQADKKVLAKSLKKTFKALKKIKSEEKFEGLLKKISNDLAIQIEKEMTKFETIESKTAKLGQSVEKHAAKTKELQQKLTDAGWKDYLWSLKKIGKSRDGEEDAALILAKHLMSDEDLLENEETKALLEHLQFNLNVVRQQPDKQQMLNELADALRALFAAEDEEVIKQLRKKQFMVSYG